MANRGIYSNELRIRALDALERGIPRKDVLKTFRISLSTLKRWLKKKREGEDLSPGTSTGRASGASSPLQRRGGLCGSSSKPTTMPPWSATASYGKSVEV